MITITEKISGSSSTRWTHVIFNEEPDPKTFASFILLRDQYRKIDADHLERMEEINKKIEFSRKFLSERQAELGGCLVCEYCDKRNLVIEYDGMKIPNFIKATVDHVTPVSKGGEKYNKKNIKVACGKCNHDKGDKTNWIPPNKRKKQLIIKNQKPTMKKSNDTLLLVIYYLVDSKGNLFTSALDKMDSEAEIHVHSLFDKNGSPIEFSGRPENLEAFCKKNEIHFGTEEKEFKFSTTTMTDSEKFWVANVHCWRQSEVQGKPLTQPRHLLLQKQSA